MNLTYVKTVFFQAMLMVPSHIWYNDTLVPFAEKNTTHSLLGIDLLPSPSVPIIFYGIEGFDDKTSDDFASWWNRMEVLKVVEIVDKLLRTYQVDFAEIGIMAPFREQVKVRFCF